MRRGYAMRKIERKHRRPAELLLVPGEGHISVLNHAARAVAWLRTAG